MVNTKKLKKMLNSAVFDDYLIKHLQLFYFSFKNLKK